MERPHVQQQLHDLERLQLTLEETPEPDLTYLFKHVIIQEVAYDLLPFAQRRRLHRSVAEWIELRQASNLAPHYALLAHLWGHAEDTAKTVDYLELSGELALRNGAYHEALQSYREALRLTTARPSAAEAGMKRRAHWERQAGEAYYALGQFAESRVHLRRALALLGRRVATSRSEVLAGLVGQSLVQAARHLPFRRASSVLAGLPARGQDNAALEAAHAYHRLALIGQILYEPLEGSEKGLRAHNLYEKAGPSPELAASYATLSMGSGVLRCSVLARFYARRAEESALSANDPRADALVGVALGSGGLGFGRWREAEDRVNRALEYFREIGDRRRVSECLSLLAPLARLQGDLASYMQLCEQLYTCAQACEDTQMQVWGLAGRAWSLLKRNQAEEAMSLVDAALALQPDRIGRVELLEVNGILALTSWQRGEPTRARDAVMRAADVTAAMRPTAPWFFEPLFNVSDACLDLWESVKLVDGQATTEQWQLARAARGVTKALQWYARLYPVGQPDSCRAAGVFEWLSGHSKHAHRLWRRSLEAALRLQMPYAEARVHYEIGRHLSRSTPVRAWHLEQARDIFKRLGVLSELDRVQAASRRVQ